MNKVTVPVIWKKYHDSIPNRGYWDMAFIEDCFERRIWNPVNGYEFKYYDDFIPDIDGAVVVLPARQHKDDIDKLNKDISNLKWCLLMLTGDEENVFDISKVKHPNILIYQMTPHMGSKADRFLINGYAPECRNLKNYPEYLSYKDLNWYFCGQVTHKRRQDCVRELREMPDGLLIEGESFTKGVTPPKYFEKMARAKIVPCPSGAVIPDTFRLYEALESGALPIADGLAPKQSVEGYWEFLFGERPPFPILNDWSNVQGTIRYFLDVYPSRNNQVFAWWQAYKRKFVYQLEEDIYYLSKKKSMDESKKNDITVLIPTSPIKDHPDTSMIEETIRTIRERLPESEIIIMFDGVRPEQSDKIPNYQEYIRRILNKCNFEWKNVLPVVFEEHHHQAAMTRECLKMVKTGCVMFVEHDAPICEYIPFDSIVDFIRSGECNIIRLHHEALILPDHMYMMLDKESIERFGMKVMRTSQWSQRPHVASTDFYRMIIEENFTVHSRTMIEDKVHGVVAEAYRTRGVSGWHKYRLWIYTPEGDMKRSYHLDGRGNESKYDMIF